MTDTPDQATAGVPPVGRAALGKRVWLVTGPPRIGKTTLVQRLVASLPQDAAGGFFTEEMRVHGEREGFRIVTLDGKAAVLASVHFRSPVRVGKYSVDLQALDGVAVSAVLQACQAGQVVIIDEIGKMELESLAFQAAVWQSFTRARRVFGTIMIGSHPIADQMKHHPDVHLITLNKDNRGQVLENARLWLRQGLQG